MIAVIRTAFYEHIGTIKGAAGLSVSAIVAHIAPILSVLVLSLTAWNLVLEIRKKSKKD